MSLVQFGMDEAQKSHPPGPTMHLGRQERLLCLTCVMRDAPMVKFLTDSNV